MTRVLLRSGRDLEGRGNVSRSSNGGGLFGGCLWRWEEGLELEVRGEEGVEGGLVLIGVDEVGSCLGAFDGEGSPIVGQCSFLGSVKCA